MLDNAWRARLATCAAFIVVALFAVGSLSATGAKEQPKEVRFVAANQVFTGVIKTLTPDYAKKTGVTVNLESYEENQLTQKLTAEFASGSSAIDVYMTRTPQEGKLFAKNGYHEFLDGCLKDASKTPAS